MEDLLCGEELTAWGQCDPFFWHAVQAPQVAPLCQRYPEVAVLAPAYEN